MAQLQVDFNVTNLHARIPESVVIQWQGQELNAGPLNIELDQTASATNRGVLDYGKRQACATFQILLTFPELVSTFELLDFDQEMMQPVCAVVSSEGLILNDHSFRLSGPCKLADHPLLGTDQTDAFVLPGI